MQHSLLVFALLGACVRDDINFEGVSAIYHTRCSATMEAKGETYLARCTPPACAEGFATGSVNHVVVAVDPGRKVVGYAERPCLQEPRLELVADDGALPGMEADERPPPSP